MNESGGGHPSSNRLVFAWLMGAAIVATAAMIPALHSLLDQDGPGIFSDPSIGKCPFVMGFAIGNVCLSAIAIAVGLRLEPTVKMGVPLIRSWIAVKKSRA